MTERLYLTRAEAAEYITRKGARISKNTLTKLACVGGGPIYRLFGNKSLYLAADLDLWIEKRISAPRVSTSQAA
ncbi:helix-turn-helix domain-containing protein [Rhodopseudomonas pseudopalustris]|uniref:helix-turn-helix transcriptional regulator n=1 Tax=Rhodopseudomonas pseudopalustris TaxID=1513892 RepID=UPI003F9AFA84